MQKRCKRDESYEEKWKGEDGIKEVVSRGEGDGKGKKDKAIERERDGMKENEEGRLREERLLPGLIERLLCK